MDIFNIVVGVFSIIGSLSGILSAIALISISNKISVKGNNNQTKSIIQTGKGIKNTNISHE